MQGLLSGRGNVQKLQFNSTPGSFGSVRADTPDVTDKLENIEALRFADRAIYPDGRNNAPVIPAQNLIGVLTE